MFPTVSDLSHLPMLEAAIKHHSRSDPTSMMSSIILSKSNISTKYWDKCHKIKNKKEPRAFTLSEILWMVSGPRENPKSKFILRDIKIQ